MLNSAAEVQWAIKMAKILIIDGHYLRENGPFAR
jgi:hypothetical protein